MCGIVACIYNEQISNKNKSDTNDHNSNTKCYDIIHRGLAILQNRGYDSAGICTITNNKKLLTNEFICHKYASTNNKTAIELLDSKSIRNNHRNSTIGIGHTRWATHGAKTDINSHPHQDFMNRISVVHNGIIENYQTLKAFLMDKGIPFKSSTDTEVISNLISYYHLWNT